MHATVCCKGNLSRISQFIIIDAISILYYIMLSILGISLQEHVK